MADGISRTMFVVGMVVAILASSLLSSVIASKWLVLQGPKGEKGDTGAQGVQGKIVYSVTDTSTTETISMNAMSGMFVSLTLNKTSDVLIMFSCEMVATNYLYFAVSINGVIWAPPGAVTTSGSQLPQVYNFYQYSLGPGTQTFQVLWRVSTGSGTAGPRTLAVLAFPV